MKNQLTALARELGFERCAFASLAPVDQEGRLHPQAETLAGDIQTLMPGAKCIMLCARPYQPFRVPDRQAHVDAYYISSNIGHERIQRLARCIEETLHIRALASPPVYIKPLAVRSGLGEFGRNGLVSAGESGTRISIHAILLDAEIETHDVMEKTLSPMCEGCGSCIRACPINALDGTGRVDIARCLRAQPEGDAYPESMRKGLRGSLLGCDICQRACPRNQKVKETDIPSDLAAALDLSHLLRGEYKPLIPFLGKNNARRQRLTARALIAAANLHRTDLLPLIRPLTECRESDMVKAHAEWAVSQLSSDQHSCQTDIQGDQP